MKLIDYPQYFAESDYSQALDSMVNFLRRQPGVVSIFQVGSVSSPGISDIDILVLFEDNITCNINPLDSLSSQERYIFMHNLFGLPRKYFYDAQRYSIFHDCKLLWGEDHQWRTYDQMTKDYDILKEQIALEFFIKMFISLSVQYTYGITKVRGLALHTKAVLYDLEFLNVNSGKLFDLVQTMIAWRNNWFQNSPSKDALENWIDDFYVIFTEFLKDILEKFKIFIPRTANFRVANNMVMVPSPQLDFSHTGVVLPRFLTFIGNKVFNLNNRINRFEFKVPITFENISKVVLERYRFISCTNAYNTRNLKYFLPVPYALPIFTSAS